MARKSNFFSLCALALLVNSAAVLGADWSGAQTAPSESECRPYIEKALKELTPTPEPQAEPQASLEETESPGGEPPSVDQVDVGRGESGPVLDEKSPEESAPESVASAEEEVVVPEAEAPAGEEPPPREEPADEVEASLPAESEPKDVLEGEEEEISQEVPTQEEEAPKESSDEKPVELSSEEAVAEEPLPEEAPQSVEEESSQPLAEEASEPETEEASEPVAEETSQAPETSEDQAEASAEGSSEVSEEAQEPAPVDEPVEEVVPDQPSEEPEAATQEEIVEEAPVEEQPPVEEPKAEEALTDEPAKEPEQGQTSEDQPAEVAEEQAPEVAPEPAVTVEAPPEESAEPASGEAPPAEEVVADQPAEEPTTTTEQSAEVPSETSTEEIAAETTQQGEIPATNDTDSEVSAQLAGDETKGPVTAAEEATPEEEDLTMSIEIPEKLRPRDHIAEILKLDSESAETEMLLSKTIDSTLRDLKKLYESAIKPLEVLYKYRDLSNRHFGDPEIFSKPLILFMGPWSGGKSTIVNYLTDNEYTKSSLRTGAEPSPAYFNIVMWGEREEVLDGTQLAADWTFSGLQKFGQGLLDRLRGLRLNKPLLEKVNIVEIPGILEIRKQVERLFPFNDACQWFIDRADIIFLVYDPSKLDVGPESEAILDQLKGREYQTRIILNKADQVKPEELMRVQGTLIWNISPLMSSTEPPVMYSTSLWSLPYESGAPTRLLYAQEKAFLKDLREAVEKRVENKIASARRFAVRVRNHAKMVDCYLTTYYNHKTFFGNKKKISDDIIEHPQNYHIYEGLSTLTNISRYDLPDPEVYKDFFRLNPVYDFQQLAATCTYFRGCPINRLDVAIAYDLPELVGKYKKNAEEVLLAAKKAKNS